VIDLRCSRCGSKVMKDWNYCPYCGEKISRTQKFLTFGGEDLWDMLMNAVQDSFRLLFNMEQQQEGDEDATMNNMAFPLGGVLQIRIRSEEMREEEEKNEDERREMRKREEKLMRNVKEVKEPESTIVEKGKKVQVTLETPGVKDKDDVLVDQHYESTEVRAFDKKKKTMYFKIINIPRGYKLIEKDVKKGKTILIFEKN